MEMYKANDNRYADMAYRRCGRSGLLLPAISLGLWHNFGSVDVFSNFIQIAHAAFDNGITHFDLANNYGPVYGSAEENFGRILKKGLGLYRDELVISTKAGYDMWPGPYGNWGSRKYLMASLDQSLKRMGLEYVDIFYRIVRTRRHRLMKRWERWQISFDREKLCISEFRTIMPNRQKRRLLSWGNIVCLV